MKSTYYYLLICAAVLIGSADASAQDSSIGAADDCTETSVNYEDDPTLTRDEKIELMDKALLKSLNKYEGCQDANSSSNSGGGGGGGGAGAGEMSGTDGAADGDGMEGGEQSGASAASSDMSGTEAPVDQKASTTGLEGEQTFEGDQTGEYETDVLPIDDESQDKAQEQVGTAGRGGTPQDIPPADNDSVLAAQIRYAAENESDPVKRKKLWDEYRKYKGLPTVNTQ